jgi:hypothetical protein
VTLRLKLTVPLIRRLVAGFPLGRPWFEPRSGHVGFVVDKVILGQVFSEYFGSPCQSSFHQLPHNHHHLSSGSGTVSQVVADVPSGLSLTPPQATAQADAGFLVRGGRFLFHGEQSASRQNFFFLPVIAFPSSRTDRSADTGRLVVNFIIHTFKTTKCFSVNVGDLVSI